ncbi:ABC transporter permease [Gryllotalpicola ginsengisoli]|uniref:ABC transporter permease n=1 Tax=Gryllotalpicola ginsengisoli TaxID=444608 RepID=UPI0003B58B13|nr:ABC transporter permease [Gryllotalpicola ginsengisoli]
MTVPNAEASFGLTEVEAGPAASTPGRGRVVRALLAKPQVVAAAGFLVLLVLLAVLAPVLTAIEGSGPNAFHSGAVDSDLGGMPIGAFGGVSGAHWFGVEPQTGRDIFARIVYGAQVSLTISLATTAVTTVVGVVLGTVAGYFGGVVDTVISRLMDILMAFPALIFMIAILSALPDGNRTLLLICVLSVFGWPYIARVIRGQTMSLRQREFVEAARVSGARLRHQLFAEVLPNLRGTIIVLATMAAPGYIGTEAALSFLGVGVVPPTPSWGQMIAASVNWFTVDPTYFLIPGAFLFLTVMSFIVIGDHAQKVLDGREA